MSLDIAKVEKVRELANGIVQARCPACAEGGNDRRGEHLRIYPDGRYGCCVHPKDSEHRKRIWALVGDRKPGTFTLRIKPANVLVVAAQSVKAALTTLSFGTLGTAKTESKNVLPAVAAPLIDESGTLGTGQTESEEVLPVISALTVPLVTKFGTAGTGENESKYILPPLAVPTVTKFGTLGTGENDSEEFLPGLIVPSVNEVGTLGTPKTDSEKILPASHPHQNTCQCQMESETAVPSVPNSTVNTFQCQMESESAVPSVPNSTADTPMPFLTAGGDLSIPFESRADTTGGVVDRVWLTRSLK